VVCADSEEVAARAAKLVAAEIGARGRTRLVLAGGTTPCRSYELLREHGVEWGRVTILFGDERCLPPHDPGSNFRMADDALLRHVAPASVHRIPAELGPDRAAGLYEPAVSGGPLDLVLLGIGQDGHTASLFPGSPALDATTLVAPVRGAPKPPPLRVTLTLRALRGARRVVILATGADKADAVRRALAGTVPAGLIPQAEWLVDAAAAGPIAQ